MAISFFPWVVEVVMPDNLKLAVTHLSCFVMTLLHLLYMLNG